MQELYIPCCYYCTFKNIVLREDQSTQPRMTNPHPTNLWFPSNCLGANGPWTKKCRRLTVLSWIVHNKTLTGSVPSSEEPQERILSFCECRSLENFARFSLQGHQNSLQNKKSIPWFLLKKLNSSTDYFPARAQHCLFFLNEKPWHKYSFKFPRGTSKASLPTSPECTNGKVKEHSALCLFLSFKCR